MNYFLRRVKQPYFKVGLFVYIALLLGGAQPAGAAVISSSTTIDWSTFKIMPIDIGNGLPTLTWDSQFTDNGVGIGGSLSFRGGPRLDHVFFKYAKRT